MKIGLMILSFPTILGKPLPRPWGDPGSPYNEVTTRCTSPTPVAMMVFDTTGMPYSKAKAKMYGKGPRAVIWPPGHPEAPGAQASEKGKGTGNDFDAR